MKKIIISIITLMLAAAMSAFAQDDDPRIRGYGFHLLEDPVNTRNVAMGSAGTALGGSGFRYYNPVAPFFSASPYISAEFGQLPGDLNKGGFESAFMSPEWFSAISFYSNAADFQTTDERGPGASASFTSTIGSTAAGYIRDNLSAGIALTFAEERVWVSSSYTAFAMSAGLGYKMFDGKLNLGAAGFHGIGWSRGLGDSVSSWREGRIPRFARGGAAWIDTVKSFPYSVAADVVYRDEDGTFTVPVGLEISPLPMIDLRVGKRIGWETEIMSFGIGLNIDRISFDAAFVPSVLVDDHEMKWSMSFTYNLGAGKPRVKEITFDEIEADVITPDPPPQDTVKNVPDEDAADVVDDEVVEDIDVDTNDDTVVEDVVVDVDDVDDVDENIVDENVVDVDEAVDVEDDVGSD